MPNPPASAAALPNHASYKDNGDGTVTDMVTGLKWERTVNGSTYTQADAATYCKGKGLGWRLPTRLELVSLVDFTVAYPGPVINGAFPGTPGDYFWTSSPGGRLGAWYVAFNTGATDIAEVQDTFRVRCVSAIDATPKCYSTRYQVKTAGEVHDAATGLTWQQNLDAVSYTWTDGKAHCPGAWRLPSFAELQTIVDDSRADPSIDLGAFPGTPAKSFWTSSPFVGDSRYAWSVLLGLGQAMIHDVTIGAQVRCVR